MKNEKGRLIDKNLDFVKGFCVPYTWGQFVHTSEMNTSYNASKLPVQIMWNLGPGVAMMSL